VDVGFSASQLELRAAVRDVLAKECPASVVRACLDDPDAWRPLWQRAVDLGWTGLALLDDESGMGLIELVAVLEEVGAAAAPIPLLSGAGLAAGVLRAAGDRGRRWQEELATGTVGALAVAATGTPPGLAANRLTGTVSGVVDAARAGLLVVLARTADGDDVAAIVRPGAGVDLTPAEAVDPSRPAARLTLDAEAEDVLPVTMPTAVTVPLVAAAAELVGLATRVLDVAVTHASTREQFDRVIGSFQGVKHRLADCYVAIERARSLTYAAAMQAVDPDADAAGSWRAAALAKAAASDAAADTARAAVQVHGALGMTWELDLHLYLRRAWQLAPMLGDSASLYRAAAAGAIVGAH
jgi:alkylation response protein AidB-like acyl-CoA dehydrogenase